MKIKTRFLGETEVREDQILSFPAGLAGMAQRRRFVLVEGEEIRPFYWLQSLEDLDFLLPVVEPAPFFPDYRVAVGDWEVAPLEITDTAHVMVLCIVTLSSDPTAIKANLQGPLVVNREKGLGKQLILIDSAYTAREDLLEACRSGAGRTCGSPAGETFQIKTRRR